METVTVDEVEVPHHKVGANRFAGKIEKSADASQECHILIHRPFDKQHVKAERVTGRQFVPHVAKCNDLFRFIFGLIVVVAFALLIEGAFPIQSTYESGQARLPACESMAAPFIASQILLMITVRNMRSHAAKE